MTKKTGTMFGLLADGKPCGKKTVIDYIPPNISPGLSTPSPVDILTVGAEGEESYAQQLSITLKSPQVIPGLTTSGTTDFQNLTGEQDSRALFLSPALNALSLANPVALIQWGNGGTQCEAEVDYINGLVINLCASWVRVRAFIDKYELAFTTTDQLPYVLAAFVGPGTPKPNNAQRTIRAQTVDSFYIPPFAKSIRMVGGDTSGLVPLAGMIEFWRDAAKAQLVGRINVTDGGDQVPQSIPLGAYFWSFTGTGGYGALADADKQTQAVFELAI